MEIKRSGSQPSGKGPADYFTGAVRIDPLGPMLGLLCGWSGCPPGGRRFLAPVVSCTQLCSQHPDTRSSDEERLHLAVQRLS